MKKKNNILINKIIKKLQEKNPFKKIISDNKKSLSYSELLKYAILNSKEIRKSKSKFIPILIDRNVESVIAMFSVILANKAFCPISNDFPEQRILFS